MGGGRPSKARSGPHDGCMTTSTLRRSSAQEIEKFDKLRSKLTAFVAWCFPELKKEAEDIVQSAYIRFGVERVLAVPESDWAWIVSVTKLVGIDEIRRRRSGKRAWQFVELTDGEAAGVELSDSQRLDAAFVLAADLDCIREELEGLLGKREAICLRVIFDFLPDRCENEDMLEAMTSEESALFLEKDGVTPDSEEVVLRRVSRSAAEVRAKIGSFMTTKSMRRRRKAINPIGSLSKGEPEELPVKSF